MHAVSYQQGLLRELQGINNNTMMHGVRTKILNKQTKRQAGSHYARFSTGIAKVNTWVATAHIHAKVRQTLSEKNIIKYKLGS